MKGRTVATGQDALAMGSPLIVVPSGFYNVDFDAAMAACVHIKDSDIGRPGSQIGKISMQMIPNLRIAVKEIQNKYGYNQKDTYATIAIYGLSNLQHKYNPELKRLKDLRSKEFYSGNKMLDLNSKYGVCQHFFQKRKDGTGSRKEIKLYGDKKSLIAAISDNADYFNLSNSDMAQVILIHAIVNWKDMPHDYLDFFSEVCMTFDKHAKEFCTT
jgi:hypothetical protein